MTILNHNKAILLVDDEEIILRSTSKDLRQIGYKVSTAISGIEALVTLENQPFDLLITDLKMAGIDGIEVLLKAKELQPNIAVIILTGYANTSSAIMALRVGADDFLQKPCHYDELLYRIDRCLEKRHLLGKLQEKNKILKEEILQRKSMEERLRNNSERVKAFAYSIAHDLKNPAIAIEGLSKLLLKRHCDILPEKGREYCRHIIKSAAQITTFVKQINTYTATLEQPLFIEEFNLSDTLQEVGKEYEHKLTKQRVELRIPLGLREIRADRLCFIRAFRNFIDNALKHGGEQLSKISITYEAFPQHHKFAIANNGKQLAKDDYLKIFDTFKRQKSAKKTDGAGLGLSIIREIAELHQGKAWGEASSHDEVTFCFTISNSL